MLKILSTIPVVVLLLLAWVYSLSPKTEPIPTAMPISHAHQMAEHSLSMHLMHVNLILLEALNDGYYSQLLPLMSEKLDLRVEGGDCCGSLTKDEVKNKLASLNKDTYPWGQKEVDQKLTNLMKKMPEYFENASVWYSNDNDLIAFKIDDKGMIEKIYLSSAQR